MRANRDAGRRAGAASVSETVRKASTRATIRCQPRTNLYYYRARYYSPKIGRFLQTDPVGTKDDLNLYAYGYSDAINNIDPAGATVRIVTRNGGNIAQYSRARGYTGSAPTSMTNRSRLMNSKDLYTIVVDPKGDPGYDEDSRTVTWNPNSAMKVEAGIQSSALALEHEVAHAAHHDEVSTEEFKKGEKPPIEVEIDSETMEIKSKIGVSPNEVIATEAEQAVSEELGGSDPARQDYNESKGGDEVHVDDPTWHCKKPNCPQ